MRRMILAAGLAVAAIPALAQTEKEESCRFQADVVAAVQAARLDSVRERQVQKTVLASDPAWPEKYNTVIPLITPWVYELPIKQVRDNDLGAVWNEQCLMQ